MKNYRLLRKAIKYGKSLGRSDPNRYILKFLCNHARGHRNAKPWSVIERHVLNELGNCISKGAFQQGLLKRSRENGFFIGSNDHEPGRGYFMIIESRDFQIMDQFYQDRIAAERQRIRQLRKQWIGISY